LTASSALIYACCTILVVPMSTTLAQSLVCNMQTDGGEAVWVVTVTPEVQCWTGTHKIFTMALALVGPVYYFLLFPYVVVSGDYRYVQRSELLHPRQWAANSKRKGTVLYVGPLHPHGDNIFQTCVLDLIAKIALSITSKALVGDPQVQMGLFFAITLCMCAETYFFPPCVLGLCNHIRLGLRCFTLNTMFCGYLTVALDDPDRPEPLCLLIVGTLFTVAATVWKVRQDLREKEKDKFRVLRLSTKQAKFAKSRCT